MCLLYRQSFLRNSSALLHFSETSNWIMCPMFGENILSSEFFIFLCIDFDSSGDMKMSSSPVRISVGTSISSSLSSTL